MSGRNEVEPIIIDSIAKTEAQNANIGELGNAGYQEDSKRVKGFCGSVVETPEDYIAYLTDKVFPIVHQHPETTRIIDRAIIRRGLAIPMQALEIPLTAEVVVPLGGEWEGYDWAMFGTHFPGRILSSATKGKLVDLAHAASELFYEEPKPLLDGFCMEALKTAGYSSDDLETLVRIFDQSFKTYVSDLSTPEKVREWIESSSVYPIVARDNTRRIVGIASGDLAKINLGNQAFRFMEIGDSASDPDYRRLGLNRNIKAKLIQYGVKMGFHSIHTETRAAWGAPNYGNAKNGMTYAGTLYSNCLISGEQTVAETDDPDLIESARHFGSLNVWTMTEKNPYWEQYK